MDLARNIINSTIPATQWALNYLNQTGHDFVKGYSEGPNVAPQPGSPESLGNFVANSPGGELAKGASMLGEHVAPLAALGLNQLRDPLGRFAADQGFNVPIHPDDIQAIAKPVENLLTNGSLDYHVNQKPIDYSTIAPIAEHYMPGVNQTLQNNPVEVARALMQRIMADRGVNGR